MATQEGLITRRQLLELGLLPEEIDRHVRVGVLVLVRRGVYARPEVWAAAGRWDQRQRLMDRAASLSTGRPHVWSHDSAALRLDMQVLKQDGRSHLTHAGRRGSHTRAGITHHHAPYTSAELDPTGHSLRLARVALDIAREHGIRAGVCAVDSALRMGATYEELEFSLERMKHWPGVSHARVRLPSVIPTPTPSPRRSGASSSRSWAMVDLRPSSACRQMGAWCGAT
ncbi:type IV toxin-antitoxin system AbiEi family antitoxin domain-containing protein [Nocardioides sp. B-3]|uniref:type IV toxin-antitoxin system AbiEi family antitoxin domain-containing protein n=1 Tax=Nocardioides sp. B-3 TaxID=2895565 RepID=UPI002152F06E|nr:type IV toxin-antitoxin system AbiEi family antitoxin domain-containing protein [Nocardioides sp. B-3]UUZ57980.1 type IV toxin-antitoxin system AbiEi family antitoxin domain-containing protein [Nocardioides sp. B-3]